MSLFDPIPKFPKKLVTTQRNLLRNAHCHILGNVGIYWDIEIICKHASKLLKLNSSGNPSESECPSPHSSGPPCHVAGGIWLRRSSPQRERERERERERRGNRILKSQTITFLHPGMFGSMCGIGHALSCRSPGTTHH